MFPLYPLLLRGATLVFKSQMLSALILNAALSCVAGMLFAMLARKLLGAEQAGSALKYLLILPSALFFFMPMTEATFLTMSVGFFYALVRRDKLLVFVFGFLAALARAQGTVLLVPFAVEAAMDVARAARAWGRLRGVKEALRAAERRRGEGAALPARRSRRRPRLCHEARDAAALLPSGLGPLCGFSCYLLINWDVYGDPFQFLVFQKEHWFQEMSYFWNTLMYLPGYMAGYIRDHDWHMVFGLSVPSITFILGSLAIIILGARKLRPSLTAYALAYFAFSVGATWLLSAPRYLACCFPLSLSLAANLKGRKRLDRFLTAAFLVLYMLYMYAWYERWAVY